MSSVGGVGLLDKALAVLDVLAAGPVPLAELPARTGLPRATAYRLAATLERHRLAVRRPDGVLLVGPRLAELAGAAADPLPRLAEPVLAALRDSTGESAQLYVRRGDERVCVAAAEPAAGLRDTVPVGARLPLTAGSAAQVLLAYADPDAVARLLPSAVFAARRLAAVRRSGVAASVGERERGVASVSAPVLAAGRLVAVVSVSGPADRLGHDPAGRHGAAVSAAAAALSAELEPSP